MYTIFAFISAFFGLVLWSYMLSYMMYTGMSLDFIRRSRLGVLRGILVAGIFILASYSWYDVQSDWMVLSGIFFLLSLPFSWTFLRFRSVLPLFLAACMWWILHYFPAYSSLIWSPFHEEIGKWYQSVTLSNPAILSPFVSLGFGFLENFRYFSYDFTLSQMLWRTLFSLPLHIFVGLFAFWAYFSLWSRTLGVGVGLLAAIAFHALYNWSLDVSLVLTLFLIIIGYMFYGWSLENAWWKKSL